MVAWLGTPRKPGFGYRRGCDEEVPNTSKIGDVSKGGVLKASTRIDSLTLEYRRRRNTSQRLNLDRQRLNLKIDYVSFFLHLLFDTATWTFSPEWSSPVDTKIYLITGAASGTSGPLVAAGQLGSSAWLASCVSDAHFAIFGNMTLDKEFRKMN
jgi:hypothetical protein